MANQMVHTVAKTAPKDDQSWLINRITDGVREAQLDLSTFTKDKSHENDYFASITDDDYEAWTKSGIPLAQITGTNTMARTIRTLPMAVMARSSASWSLRCMCSSLVPVSRISIRLSASAIWVLSIRRICRTPLISARRSWRDCSLIMTRAPQLRM